MKMKFGIKEVVATGIGTALFVALTEVQIPLGFIPNTALQPWSDFSLQNMRSRTADSRRNRSCCSTLCRLLPTSLHG